MTRTSTPHRYLLCSPTHLEASDEVNPWMDVIRATATERDAVVLGLTAVGDGARVVVAPELLQGGGARCCTLEIRTAP